MGKAENSASQGRQVCNSYDEKIIVGFVKDCLNFTTQKLSREISEQFPWPVMDATQEMERLKL